MAKRNLNRRQQWRIEKIQKERTDRAARKDQKTQKLDMAGELGEPEQGLLITHFGKQVEVEALEGEHKGSHYRCHIRANLGALVTGDKVVWRPGSEQPGETEVTGVIEAVHERASLLQRPDIYGKLRPVAANIDHLVIVIAAEPEPFENLIDRSIVAAETLKIPPVILLNKTDLINDSNRERIEGIINQYAQLGYPILQANCHQGHAGIQELIHWLDQQTCVFVGQSWVNPHPFKHSYQKNI